MSKAETQPKEPVASASGVTDIEALMTSSAPRETKLARLNAEKKRLLAIVANDRLTLGSAEGARLVKVEEALLELDAAS